MKKILLITILFLTPNFAISDEAQLFGIKMYQNLFKSIDQDTWLKEKCIKKQSYSAFIRYQEVPKYNDMFPSVRAELSKCVVKSVHAKGFFKGKRKCISKIKPLMKITIKRLSKDYNVSDIKKGNPFLDDENSFSADIKGKGRDMILFGFCIKDPQGYFMRYGITDKSYVPYHVRYKGKKNPNKGL